MRQNIIIIETYVDSGHISTSAVLDPFFSLQLDWLDEDFASQCAEKHKQGAQKGVYN